MKVIFVLVSLLGLSACVVETPKVEVVAKKAIGHPSLENYNQIKGGMTVAEVEELLGKGSDFVLEDVKTWDSGTSWDSKRMTIYVTFQNGCVQAKAFAD